MNIKSVLRSAGELLLGEVVGETDEYIDFVDLSFLTVGGSQNPGQIAIQFVPVDLLSIQPMPVPIKAVMDSEAEKLVIRLYKNQLLCADVKLKQEILDNYRTAKDPNAIVTPSKRIITPDDSSGKIINLYDK